MRPKSGQGRTCPAPLAENETSRHDSPTGAGLSDRRGRLGAIVARGDHHGDVGPSQLLAEM